MQLIFGNFFQSYNILVNISMTENWFKALFDDWQFSSNVWDLKESVEP